MNLTYSYVRELFDYRPDGFLIWKVRKGGKTMGSVAGPKAKVGYSFIVVDGKAHRAHRLIWLWHHGYMPEGDLDHINRIKHDNRIENLREVSRQCNIRNTGNQKNNKSGVRGVCGKDVFRVQIAVNKKQYWLGNFKCFDEAVLTRLAAEQCLDWDGCDSSSPAYQYAKSCGLIK